MPYFCGKKHSFRDRHAFAEHDRHVVASRDSQKTPTHDEIARLAYSYWEARGRQGGSPVEDWLRAEDELKQQ